jgi:RNA polymerase sigma-70 factor (ECF subfamily)
VADEPLGSVTALLRAMRAGDGRAKNQLITLVYEELRRVAADLLRRERPGHILQPTALVHEVILRLLRSETPTETWDRAAFLAVAAQAMRRVLVDHARRRAAGKRGGGQAHVPLDEALDCLAREKLDVLTLHEALEDLKSLHERQSQVVELRYFGGFMVKEIADILNVSVSTVESDFRKAVAYLRKHLSEEA